MQNAKNSKKCLFPFKVHPTSGFECLEKNPFSATWSRFSLTYLRTSANSSTVCHPCHRYTTCPSPVGARPGSSPLRGPDNPSPLALGCDDAPKHDAPFAAKDEPHEVLPRTHPSKRASAQREQSRGSWVVVCSLEFVRCTLAAPTTTTNNSNMCIFNIGLVNT